MSVVDEMLSRLETRGSGRYGGEAVSQLQHALQTANHARRSGADSALVTAALLHDIGHLVDGAYRREHAEDRQHETLGAKYLAQWFPAAVTEPIRLHVPAKRFLCAVEADYADGLSAVSVRSLAQQGGQFNQSECWAFLQQPHARDAVALRRWDDLAKDADAAVLDPADFRQSVEQCQSR